MPAGVGYGLENVAQFLMEYFREQRASEREALERAMREKERREDVAFRTQQAEFQQKQFEDEQAGRARQTLLALQERVPNAAISPTQAEQAEALGLAGILNRLPAEPFTGPPLPTAEGVEGERPIVPEASFFRPTRQHEQETAEREDRLAREALAQALGEKQFGLQEKQFGLSEEIQRGQLDVNRSTAESLGTLRQGQEETRQRSDALDAINDEYRQLTIQLKAALDSTIPNAALVEALGNKLGVLEIEAQRLRRGIGRTRVIDPNNPFAGIDPNTPFPGRR